MNALDLASDRAIRAVLKALCTDPAIRSKTLNYLAQLEPQTAQAAEVTSQPKHKATHGLSICVHCETSFDEADNTVKECQYHPGELEPDYESDVWADHDENCHGRINSDFCREEYPQGFLWDCCDNIGTDPGCQLDRHLFDPERYKRQRSNDSAEETDSTEEESDEEGESEEEDE